MFDIEIRSHFEGDHTRIVFPFNTKEEAVKEIEKRFPNKDGWELDEDKYYKGKYYYDWCGNPSYEIRIRAV